MYANLTDLSHNTSVVSLAFTQNMPFLNKIIIKGCTSLDPDIMIAKLGCCKTLTVLDITSCIQLEEDHVFGLIQVCKQLPLLKIFKAEWSCQFSPETVIDILSSSNLSELAVTPSNWGSPLCVTNYVIIYVTIRATCNSGVLNNKEDQVFKCSLRHYFVVTIVVTVVPGPGSR